MSEKIVEDLKKLIKHDKKSIKAVKEKRLKFIEECNLVIKNGKERIRLNKETLRKVLAEMNGDIEVRPAMSVAGEPANDFMSDLNKHISRMLVKDDRATHDLIVRILNTLPKYSMFSIRGFNVPLKRCVNEEDNKVVLNILVDFFSDGKCTIDKCGIISQHNKDVKLLIGIHSDSINRIIAWKNKPMTRDVMMSDEYRPCHRTSQTLYKVYGEVTYTLMINLEYDGTCTVYMGKYSQDTPLHVIDRIISDTHMFKSVKEDVFLKFPIENEQAVDVVSNDSNVNKLLDDMTRNDVFDSHFKIRILPPTLSKSEINMIMTAYNHVQVSADGSKIEAIDNTKISTDNTDTHFKLRLVDYDDSIDDMKFIHIAVIKSSIDYFASSVICKSNGDVYMKWQILTEEDVRVLRESAKDIICNINSLPNKASVLGVIADTANLTPTFKLVKS